MKKITILLISLFFITGCSQSQNNNNLSEKYVENNISESNTTEDLNCAKKGEQAYTMDELYSQNLENIEDHCCEDLKPLEGYGLLNGECEIVFGPSIICMPCGDGICEFSEEENMCNCPEDCKQATKDCADLNERIKGEEAGNTWTLSWLPDKCCGDLVPVYTSWQRDFMVCISCGDGVCADDENEWWQTCPQDCESKNKYDPDKDTRMDEILEEHKEFLNKMDPLKMN